MGTVLLNAEHRKGTIRFLGEVVLNADSVLPWSMTVASQLHTLLNLTLPLSLSRGRGLNAFPWEYRADCLRMARLPILRRFNSTLQPPFPDGDAWLSDTLAKAPPGSVTVVSTTALTNLVDVLKARPALRRAIRRLVWMGGAVGVPGNLDPKQFPEWNKKAEWNVYFDPEAAAWLFDHTDIPVLLFPLDVSDGTPITAEFMELLAERRNQSQLDALIFDSYSLVMDEPFYRLWDTVAVAYIGHPEYFLPPVDMRLKVVTDLIDQGALVRDPAGRQVKVFQDFAPGGKAALYRYVASPRRGR
mmetsp:Transcript_70016/g.123419  ORF Transcript_70016/g.123419 Transcript_70016/m.123419 type:complete len:301 (-) Transcript_70016:25-927(-)